MVQFGRGGRWAAALCLLVSGAAIAQADDADDALIDQFYDMPLWLKQVHSVKELTECVSQLRSADAAKQDAALLKLAQARPDLRVSRQVLAAVKPVHAARKANKFVSRAYLEICRTWESAQKSAEMLAKAKRAGGYAYLEGLMTGRTTSETYYAITALSFTNDPKAAEVLVRQYDRHRLQIEKALSDLGPAAAPAVAGMLQSSRWPTRNTAARLLKRIGTSKELPALEKARSDTSPLVQNSVREAVAAVKASDR